MLHHLGSLRCHLIPRSQLHAPETGKGDFLSVRTHSPWLCWLLVPSLTSSSHIETRVRRNDNSSLSAQNKDIPLKIASRKIYLPSVWQNCASFVFIRELLPRFISFLVDWNQAGLAESKTTVKVLHRLQFHAEINFSAETCQGDQLPFFGNSSDVISCAYQSGF